MKCPNCNFESPDTAKFCEKCGAPLPTEPPKPQQTYTYGSAGQNTSTANPYTYAAPAATAPEKTETVGFWAFFGLLILFALPFIGWIACIVFCFAPENKSMKNFAREMLA